MKSKKFSIVIILLCITMLLSGCGLMTAAAGGFAASQLFGNKGDSTLETLAKESTKNNYDKMRDQAKADYEAKLQAEKDNANVLSEVAAWFGVKNEYANNKRAAADEYKAALDNISAIQQNNAESGKLDANTMTQSSSFILWIVLIAVGLIVLIIIIKKLFFKPQRQPMLVSSPTMMPPPMLPPVHEQTMLDQSFANQNMRTRRRPR